MLTVYALPLDHGLPESDPEFLFRFCEKEKTAAIRRLVRHQDRLRGLWSALLVRALICRDLEIPNHEVRLARGPRGKPFLPSHPSYHFNASHSGNWILAATSDRPVGVDIEEIRPTDLAIANSYFSQAEAEALNALPEPQRLGFFFSLWVLKESYLKATGEGLFRGLASFSVSLAEGGASLQVPPGKPTMHLKEYTVAPGYRAGACGHYREFPKEARRLSGGEVLAALMGA